MSETSSLPVEEAGRLIDNGLVDQAIGLLQRELRYAPDSSILHLKLAHAFTEKSRAGGRRFLKMAERECGEALRCAPADRMLHDMIVELGGKWRLGSQLIAQYRGPFKHLPFAEDCVRNAFATDPTAGTPFLREFTGLLAEHRPKILIVALLIAAGIWYNIRTPSGFALKSLSGERVALSDYSGAPILVLDFWATWSKPCRDSLPVLDELGAAYAGTGVEVLTVNLREDRDRVLRFVNDHRLEVPVLLDPTGSVSGSYEVRGIPTILVLDPKRKIRHTYVGWGDAMRRELEDVITDLLAEVRESP